MDQQALDCLKRLDQSMEHVRSMNNLSERVVRSIEAIERSVQHIEQLIDKSWSAYAGLANEAKKMR